MNKELPPYRCGLDDAEIRAIALYCGLELKPQPDGTEDLNPCVYKFANEILSTMPTPEEVARFRNAIIDAPTPPVAEPGEYLLNGARFKMSFNGAGNVSCFRGYKDELDGRWVALVDAENDRHLQGHPADENLRKAAEEVIAAFRHTPLLQLNQHAALMHLEKILENQ